VTVETAVWTKLSATAGVSSIASTRVYQLVLPQKPTLPAVRVQLVDEPKTYHMRGGVLLTRALVQTDCFGAESGGYAPIETLAAAVEAALTGEPFFVGTPSAIEITGAFRVSRRPMFESGELRQVRISQDFVVWSRAVN
jgi:hypothetical protein